jgi:WD40 repeat protein
MTRAGRWGVVLELAALAAVALSCTGGTTGGGGRQYEVLAQQSVPTQVTALQSSADGAWLAVGLNGALQLRGPTGVPVTPAVQPGYIQALAFNANGATLFSGGQGNGLAAWNTTSGAQERALTDAVFPVRAVATSQSGLVAAAFGDNTIRVFGQTGSETGRWLQHAVALAFVDDSTIVTAGADGVVRRFSPTGSALGQFSAHVSGVAAMAVQGARVATAGFDGTVRVSTVMGAEEAVHTPGGTVTAVAFSSNGTLAAGTQEGDILVFTSSTPQRLAAGSAVTGLTGSALTRFHAGTQGGVLLTVDLPPLGD